MDDNLTGEERNKLILRNLSLVDKIAWKIFRKISRFIDIDDLVGAGRLGLVEAGRNYKGRPGAKFETYAGYRIGGEIYDEVRRINILSRAAVKRNMKGESNVSVVSLDTEKLEQIKDEKNITQEILFESCQNKKILKKKIEDLPPRERQAVKLFCYKGLSAKAAGKRMKISQSWARYVYINAVKLLQAS